LLMHDVRASAAMARAAIDLGTGISK